MLIWFCFSFCIPPLHSFSLNILTAPSRQRYRGIASTTYANPSRMRVVRSVLSRPLVGRRLCSSGPVSVDDEASSKAASNVLGNFSNTTVPTIGQHHLRQTPSAQSFISKLESATADTTRIPTSLSTDASSESSALSSSDELSLSMATFTNAVRMRTSEKPFSQRLAALVTEILSGSSNDLSTTLLEADLATNDIRIATTVVNLKTTLQSSFAIFLSHPISLAHLSHVSTALSTVHLRALRPDHSFSLINQREQQMPAFSLLNAADPPTASIVRGGFGRQQTSYFPKLEGTASNSGTQEEAAQARGSGKVCFIVSVATSIVDEEFSLTTCKVHSERDNAGLTLLWLTFLHKMTASEQLFSP